MAFERKKIWDPVSRVWHWVFAAALISNWIVGHNMTFDNIKWHFYTGFFVIGLLIFRVIWGFVGPKPIRFASFFPTPRALFNYLKTFHKRVPSGAHGHNPLGALSVFAMLVVVAGQVTTGLFIESDDFYEQAPLNAFVYSDLAGTLNLWHHWLSVALLVLVLLHVAAIIFYKVWKHENLVSAMITGWKTVRKKD